MTIRSSMTYRSCCVWLLACFGLCSVGYADDSRLQFLEITERGNHQAEIHWRSIATATKASDPVWPAVSLDACETVSTNASETFSTRKRLLPCSKPLDGALLSLRYAPGAPIQATLVRLSRLDGSTQNVLMPAGESSVRLPQSESLDDVSSRYFVYGFEHILIGYDHLLFIACLVLIARRVKTLLITVTGFTLAHSITLALSVLGIVYVRVAIIEVLIALSIVFLATELIRNRRTTVTWRYPVTVSSAFGLLHGFGFAAVLNDLGFPETELAKALLFFNLGVEAGQLVFVAGFLCFLVLLAKTPLRAYLADLALNQIADSGQRRAAYGQAMVGYAVGAVATYWMVERLVI